MPKPCPLIAGISADRSESGYRAGEAPRSDLLRADRERVLDDPIRVVWNDLHEFSWVGPAVLSTGDGSPFIGIIPVALWPHVIDNVIKLRIEPNHRSQ